MAVSVDYVAKETAQNLWRNRVMAIAAILTVAVSLSLVGTALLLRQAVKRQIGEWSNNVSLQVFMDPERDDGRDRQRRIADRADPAGHEVHLPRPPGVLRPGEADPRLDADGARGAHPGDDADGLPLPAEEPERRGDRRCAVQREANGRVPGVYHAT